MTEPNTKSVPVLTPELVLSIQHCDVLEADLARRVLYICGFCVRREEDTLLVFKPKSKREGSLEGRTTPFYADKKEFPTKDALGGLYIDEGFYSDTLRVDMSRGYNSPWSELIDMANLLGILARYYEPEYKVEPSPYIGHGRSTQHYFSQHVEALVKGDQNKHPRLRIER